MQEGEYHLGHADDEVRRQQVQANIMEPMTRSLLAACGVGPGQVVLDIGCGPGDVALIAAEKVGPKGMVIGVDVGPKVLEVARQRASAAGYTNLHFYEGSDADLSQQPEFDVALGRLVLIHQKEPVQFVKNVAAKVRPGGIVAFHEHAGIAPPSCRPQFSLYDEILQTITNCFQSSFNYPCAAFEMSEIFHKAGLGVPRLSSAYPVVSNSDSEIFEWCELCLKGFYSMGTLRNPRYDVTTVKSRLRDGFVNLHSQVLGMLEFTGWALKAGEQQS